MAEIEGIVTEIVEKVIENVQETEEEFIFQTISAYCNNVTQKVVSKEDLKKALLNYYGNRMTGNEYQKLAGRTINHILTIREKESHALHGMVGEIGEIHSLFQKVFQGHEMDDEHLQKEVGDLLWFIAEFCTVRGWNLEDIMIQNIEKLKARFPDGFEIDKSVHRKEGDI